MSSPKLSSTSIQNLSRFSLDALEKTSIHRIISKFIRIAENLNIYYLYIKKVLLLWYRNYGVVFVERGGGQLKKNRTCPKVYQVW